MFYRFYSFKRNNRN